jgi:predicted DNA-binding transcriptional regulator AlpA
MTLVSDPIRILCLSDVSRRTGYSPRKIRRLLAEDVAHGTPDYRFPRPLRSLGGVGKDEWAESDIAKWLNRRMQR